MVLNNYIRVTLLKLDYVNNNKRVNIIFNIHNIIFHKAKEISSQGKL